MQCLDDKAIVPIGEPGKPTGISHRSHNRGLVSGTGQELLSLDHDYHICGLVPSVFLDVNIPSEVKGSFHRGDVHITVKDKIFQPSSPLRHATETVKIVRENSADGVHSFSPIIVRYTDGGPDHRTTYTSVQYAAIVEFIALDLDMFVACRTAPNQSYNNPAERVMSLLNLGLQNVSLARAEMEAGQEIIMKSMTSLKKIRNCRKQSLKDALIESVNAPMDIVKEIFSRLRRKHGQVFVHSACEEEEIEDLKSMMRLISCGEDVDPKQKFGANEKLNDFVARHCRERHYVYQIKKCDLENIDSCPYCSLSPPRIPDDRYADLHFLPDPVLDEDGKYKSFEQVYGTETTEQDRPSLKIRPELSDRDKKYKSIMVAGKVRGFVLCAECGKRRVVYSVTRLTRPQEQLLIRVQEELLYICGNTLFPGGPMQDVTLVKEGLNCTSPIETSYYAGITQTFDEICYYCGDLDILRNDEIAQLKEEFSIVRPICPTCYNVKHLKPATRNARKTKKQKTK